MNQAQCVLPLALLVLALAAPATAQNAAPASADPVTPYADIRYRLEMVDQDGLPKDAAASVLRIRAGVRTAEWQGFSALAEGEAIAAIGARNYNDTVNGKVAYPIVADPTAVLLNQAWVRWRPVKQVEAVAGRQAINLDNQRWIGSVGWRQNDQTFDAARVTAKPAEGLAIDYVYSWRVNRVFGPDSPQGIWRDTDIHGLRAGYTIKGIGTLSGYGYWLEIPLAPASSSRTLGVRIAGERAIGKDAKLLYTAEYARQSDFGPNPRDFALDYLMLESGAALGAFTLKGGYERLEGNGTVALQTPLATLHAFNGWADKFLTTPANGLRDLYFDAGWKAGKGPVKGLGLRIAWHDYNPTAGGIRYGREWNALMTYPLTKQITVLTKLARYHADAFATDTTKAWFAVEAKF